MKTVLSLFFTFFFIQTSLAQLVNIEKERKEKKQGLQGAIAFSLSFKKNTSSIFIANNNTNIQYTKNKHTLLFLNDYSIINVKIDKNNTDLENNNFQHLRYNYSLLDSNKITFELFGQRQQNKIKFLNLRLLAGTGFRFKIIDKDYLSFYIATLAMYEKEELSDSLKSLTSTIKGDFYSSISVTITDNLSFKNVVYYQPALVNLNNYQDFEFIKDYRLFIESSLKFKIYKNIFYELQFHMSYDSKPPIELINTPLFYDFTNQLTFKF